MYRAESAPAYLWGGFWFTVSLHSLQSLRGGEVTLDSVSELGHPSPGHVLSRIRRNLRVSMRPRQESNLRPKD